MKARNLVPLVLAVAALACAPPRYTYSPVATTTTTSADLAGAAATETPLRGGLVRMAALGVGNVTAPAGSGIADQRVLFVRMYLENKSSDEWVVDEAELRMETVRRGETIASYATTPTAVRPPIVKIASSASATLDLLFPLPLGVEDAAALPSFDIVWTVHAGGRVVQDRTAFARIRNEPPATEPSPPILDKDLSPAPRTVPGWRGPNPAPWPPPEEHRR